MTPQRRIQCCIYCTDSEREIAPLRKADDAIKIDTSTLTIDEQTARIVALAHQTIQRL